MIKKSTMNFASTILISSIIVTILCHLLIYGINLTDVK